MTKTHDTLIIGGGAIGLSLARELAGRGCAVAVVERGLFGGEASWAGAGILPAASFRSQDEPLHQLAGLSMCLHSECAAELYEETGIDTGYRTPGELFVAFDAEQVVQLQAWDEEWSVRELQPNVLTVEELREIEPVVNDSDPRLAVYLPGSGQLRNPRHLKALLASCHRRGVALLDGVTVQDFERKHDRIIAVRTDRGRIEAADYCLCGGAWSVELAARLGHPLAIKPIRGQMVLLRQQCATFSRVINEGLRYAVPRCDGRVLIGATMEDAGFEKRNTAQGVRGLLKLAERLIPSLAEARVEKTWSGLRPGTADGLPYLGRFPGIANGYAATGHFRSGLQLSTGTARVMGDLLLSTNPAIQLDAFRIDRA